jgi:Mg2+ and Co2+ transporter CorA
VEVDHIDTHAPLLLHSVNKVLLLDFLAIHMIRNINGSTTLSFHHDMDGSTTAEEMFSRLKLVGRSVYWQIIVRKSKDPTFVFLGILWSALYAWDQALEALYDHFCKLESRVITTNNVALTYELHVIRAHLLHYTSLLRDFEESVKFIRDTHNPAMDHESITDDERKDDKALLDRECQHLLTEIKRLQMNRQMQDDRVENVKHLVYAIVNIEDSRAMKRLSYITMIFLPASFMAAIFGMNVMELNPGTLGTLPHYAEASVPLTFATIWIIVAYQNRFVLRDNQAIWKKLLWPAALVHGLTAPRDSSPV